MPPKVDKKTVAPTAQKSGPIVSKAKKEQKKEKPKQIIHDFIASQQKLPEVLDENGLPLLDKNGNEVQLSFGDAISFYEKQFMKELCVSRSYMDQEVTKRYLINSRTGAPYDSFVRSYQFKYNNDNSVKIGERSISLTKFLTNEKFCNSLIAYYKALGYECDVYQTGFDKTKNQYSKACVKVYF